VSSKPSSLSRCKIIGFGLSCDGLIKTKETKMNRKFSTSFVVRAGIVASLYTVLTVLTNAFGLASGVIQVRLSEALTILPVYTLCAVPGLFVGCLVSNLLTGCAMADVVFGSVATLIGAVFTRMLRKNVYLASLPPVVSNAVIVPFVLRFVYGLEDAWWFMVVSVGAGEIISCCVLGILLSVGIKRYKLDKILK